MISKSEVTKGLEAEKKCLITTAHFADEYQKISTQLSDIRIDTDRRDSLKKLNEGLNKIKENDALSPDAKIIALLDLFANEYDLILHTLGGSSSRLGKFIQSFCDKNFGVEFGKAPLYRLKKDGLMMRILIDQLGMASQIVEEDHLLPPIKNKSTELNHVSQSAPVVGTSKMVEPKITPSVDIIGVEGEEVVQPTLRKDKEWTRLGSMFGTSQFCYAEKPGGVEPGFRAIDLNELFFQELEKLLADEHLPSKDQLFDEERAKLVGLRDALKIESLNRKQILFSTFINAHMKGPHERGLIHPNIQWLCNHVKEAVAKNNRLSAWMYKLDYAEGQKDRIKANKEAIREFVGTRLAGIFSAQNQKQDITWVNNGKKGAHALLACGWKNGLQELTQFLYGGSEPDYNGVLVEDKEALIKRSKYIPGLAKNLIFGIAIGDRDGMGKEAQNKGFADGAYYGFDYGKPYEGEGVCSSISDDFSFEDSFAKAPAIFRGSSKIGFARHYMYRNYSVFYDTVLSERMVGFHLLRKMITGENPSEEVIQSYPGLRQELYRIQESTPSLHELLNQLGDLRSNCREGSPLQALIDTHMIQICMGKLSTFDLYFTKIKIDLIDMATKNGMPYEELADYIKFIDEMAAIAHNSNQHILTKFEQRRLLTRQEIDLVDKLEKYFSPTSVMSYDGTAFLNTMRFDPQSDRIPFQLKREENGTYTLSTTNTKIVRQLKDEFGLKCTQDDSGLSCNITPESVIKLMVDAEVKYNLKRENLLIKPIYQFITFPYLSFLLNKNNEPEAPKIEVSFLWREDNSLSLRIVAKTDRQAQLVQQIFGILPAVQEAQIVEIPPEKHHEYQQLVTKAYEEEQRLMQLKTSVRVEQREDVLSTLSHLRAQISPCATGKWKEIHQKSNEEAFDASSPVALLMKRLASLISDERVWGQMKHAVEEITDPSVIEKLMQYNDKTLSSPDNINAVLEERFADIRVIADELDVSAPTVTICNKHSFNDKF